MASSEMRTWEDKVQELHFQWYSGSYRVRRPTRPPARPSASPTPKAQPVQPPRPWREYALMGIDILGVVILIGAMVVSFYLLRESQVVGWLWEQAQMMPEALELGEVQREVTSMLGQLADWSDVQQLLGG